MVPVTGVRIVMGSTYKCKRFERLQIGGVVPVPRGRPEEANSPLPQGEPVDAGLYFRIDQPDARAGI